MAARNGIRQRRKSGMGVGELGAGKTGVDKGRTLTGRLRFREGAVRASKGTVCQAGKAHLEQIKRRVSGH